MNNYEYIDSQRGIEKLTEELKGARRAALDTEADSLHHYFEKVCLIQLSFDGKSYIVDPLAKISFENFLEVLSRKPLIIQGVNYDLRLMRRSLKFLPKEPVFDTMIAAQMLGYKEIGLAALAEKFCGVKLSKSGQKSDWSIRPLKENLLRYAADDTRFLEKIADALEENLRLAGRLAWHKESCSRAVASALSPEVISTKEGWRKGTQKLPPKTLAYVKKVWFWRDDEARKRDKPPFMILRNENLIDFATKCAEKNGEIDFNKITYLKRAKPDSISRLKEIILKVAMLSPGEWPEIAKGKIKHKGTDVDPREIESLMAAVREVAEEKKLETSFLASRATITAIVREKASDIDTICRAGGITKWQAEILLPLVKGLMHSLVHK